MSNVIQRDLDLTGYRAGTCAYAEAPVIEREATREQMEAITFLGATIVVHSFLGAHAGYALVSYNDPEPGASGAAWIDPLGIVTPAGMGHAHHCRGNPTVANCIANGYCRRSYACNE